MSDDRKNEKKIPVEMPRIKKNAAIIPAVGAVSGSETHLGAYIMAKDDRYPDDNPRIIPPVR